MQVFIEGSRSSSRDWMLAQTMPADQLPPLSLEQKQVAQQLGISEEAAARGVKARELSLPGLAHKAETVGRFVETVLRERFAEAFVEEVTLATLHGRIEVRAQVQRRGVYLCISEDLVDEMLQTGSEESERKLRKIIQLNLSTAIS